VFEKLGVRFKLCNASWYTLHTSGSKNAGTHIILTVYEVSLCSVVQWPAAMLLLAGNFRTLVIMLFNNDRSDSMIVLREIELLTFLTLKKTDCLNKTNNE
jgi:hypothetical protein